MARNLIIIDDDPSVRFSLALLLESLPDTQVHSFASGDLFLDEAEKLLPACLVLDLDMPGTSGLGVLERLHGTGKAVIAIILTGAGDIDMAVQAMKLGASDFLEKPCNHRRLLEAVEIAFSRQADLLGHETRRSLALAKLASLSLREKDVLVGLLNGQSNKLIAHDLGISHRTVEIYRAKLLEKLAVRNVADAFRIAFSAGLYQEK